MHEERHLILVLRLGFAILRPHVLRPDRAASDDGGQMQRKRRAEKERDCELTRPALQLCISRPLPRACLHSCSTTCRCCCLSSPSPSPSPAAADRCQLGVELFSLRVVGRHHESRALRRHNHHADVTRLKEGLQGRWRKGRGARESKAAAAKQQQQSERIELAELHSLFDPIPPTTRCPFVCCCSDAAMPVHP